MSVLHIFYLLMRILDQPLWLKSKKMFVLGHIETVLSVTCFFFLLLLFLFSFCDETVVMEFKRDFAIVTRTVCVSIWYHFRKCGEHVQMPRMQGFVKLLWVHRLVTISIVFCVCLRERDMKQKWGQCLMAVMIIHGIMNSQQFQNVIMLCYNKKTLWWLRGKQIKGPVYSALDRVTGIPPWSQSWSRSSRVSTWWPGLSPWNLTGLSSKKLYGSALLWNHHPQEGL